MGSSSSKAARTAAGSAVRKYPARPSGQVQSAPNSVTHADKPDGPTVHPKPQASFTRSQAIDQDARDPQLDASLRKLGPVQPFPTFSPSSTSAPQPAESAQGQTSQSPVYPSAKSNPAIAILTARNRILNEIEQEKIDAGKKDYSGRKFMDVGTVRKVLVLRDEQKMPASEIESMLKLRPGTVAMLGRAGVVEAP